MKIAIALLLLASTPADEDGILLFHEPRPTATIVLPAEDTSDVWTMLECFLHWRPLACEQLLVRVAAELLDGDQAELCLRVGKRLDCLPIQIDIPEPAPSSSEAAERSPAKETGGE
jgi:hypothetical protein